MPCRCRHASTAKRRIGKCARFSQSSPVLERKIMAPAAIYINRPIAVAETLGRS